MYAQTLAGRPLSRITELQRSQWPVILRLPKQKLLVIDLEKTK